MTNMTFFLILRRVFDLPVAPDRHRTAGKWQPGRHGGDGGDGRRPGVDAAMPGFLAYGKKGGAQGMDDRIMALGGVALGADEVVAAFFGDYAHGRLFVVESIGCDECVFESDLGIG